MDNISSVFLVNRQLNRFKFLLWSLFMLIGLRPLLSEWLGGGRIWADVLADSFFACALMSGLHAVSGQPRQQNLAAFLTVAIVVLGILHYLLQISVLDKLQQALSAIFLLQMLVMIWVHINQSTQITLELIMAAACAYILLGMSWAYGYFFWNSPALNPLKYRTS